MLAGTEVVLVGDTYIVYISLFVFFDIRGRDRYGMFCIMERERERLGKFESAEPWVCWVGGAVWREVLYIYKYQRIQYLTSTGAFYHHIQSTVHSPVILTSQIPLHQIPEPKNLIDIPCPRTSSL